MICGFGWAVIDAFVRFIVTKDYVMSLKTIIGWPFGKGALAQFWFLGTMMMIYIVLIPLKKICKKNLWPVLAVFITICAIEDVVNLIRVVNGADTFIQKTISQPFRLWTWITYILIGAVLQRIQSKVSFRKLICACAIFTPCAIGWMYYLMYYKTDIIDGSYMYDSLIVMLWSSIMFLTLVSIPFSSEKVKRNVVNCGKFLIPVYALHYEFIRIAVMFYGFKQPWMQICLGVVVIFIAILCGMVIDKIPYLRRINSL